MIAKHLAANFTNSLIDSEHIFIVCAVSYTFDDDDDDNNKNMYRISERDNT